MGDRSMGRKLYSALMFVFVSVLGGVLAAGLVVPTAGIAAELAKSGAQMVDSIPQDVETPPPAEGSKVLLADGSVLTNFYDQNRVYVPLSEISPIMQAAQIAVEDQRFYEHGALDLRGTLRALVRTSSGNTQGGSTLTQQYVKLALLDKAVAENDKEGIAAVYNRTVARKVLELRYAIALEQRLTKDQILERYLNISYYGDGAYGVEAAARHYFGTTAKDLDLAQSAMLAGLVRNPATTDPVNHEKIAIERRNNVVDVMAAQGVITRAEATEVKQVPFDQSKVVETKHGCQSSQYPHLCDVVKRTLLQTESLGPDSDSRMSLLNRGGLTIQTMIDPRTQDAAQQAVSSYVHATDPVIGVMVMIEPGTGLIKAVAQSRYEMGNEPGQTYWNYAMEGNLGGAEGYFGGSTFKAFTLAAAIEKGIPTSRTYNAPRSMDFTGQVFTTCDGSYRIPAREPWTVTTGSAGNYDMYAGARASSNTYFVQLEQDTGLCEVTTMAEKLGLHLADGRDMQTQQNPSFTLGTADIAPISLANAYATLAARGLRCDPIILKSAVGKDGQEYEVPSANCQQVVPQEVADTVNDVLREPFKGGGTAARANIPGYNLAGKTGTDTNAPTIWMVGYTPQLAGAAMITVDKKAERYARVAPDRRSLEGAPVRSNSARLRGSSGNETGAGIWKPAMETALQGLERGDFVEPPSTSRTGKLVDVPSCSGMGLERCRDTLEAAGFNTVVSRTANSRSAGTFLGITPRGRAPQFSTIRLLVSAGPAQRRQTQQTQQTQPRQQEQAPAAEPPAQQDAGGGDEGGGDEGEGNG